VAAVAAVYSQGEAKKGLANLPALSSLEPGDRIDTRFHSNPPSLSP